MTLGILIVIALAMIALWAPANRWLVARGGAMSVTGAVAASMTLSGALLWALFWLFELNIEQHGVLMWLWLGATAVLTGTVTAARAHRVPTVELLLATAAVLEVAALLLVLLGDDPGISDPPVRTLLVSPAVIGLGAYFGASVGYLLWGDRGGADLAIGYEATVGRRFLLSKASSVLSTVTTISVVGVALGVWLVIVALAILAGFEFDLQSKIIGANAHIALQRNGGRSFSLPEGTLARIDTVDGVVKSAPYVQGEVAVASSTNFTGALLFGIDPVRGPQVLTVLEKRLLHGSLAPLQKDAEAPAVPPAIKDDLGLPPPAPVPHLVVGVEMKKALNITEGDRLTVLSPLLENLTPLGPVPASRPFRAAGVFSSEMYEFDARFAYASISAVRRFFQLQSRHVSGVQIRVEHPAYADRIGRRVAAALGGKPCPKGHEDQRFDCGWEALDWKSRNQTLFAALKLERVVAFVVLVFIILVASFSIVNTLTMSVIEKQKEIAILKTMGARDVGIMKLFLVQGMTVGIFGALLGATAAMLTVLALETFGFWIPGAVYYIDSLPVHLEVSDVILVVLAALLIVWDFAVFPALRGSKLEPVEGLRDG